MKQKMSVAVIWVAETHMQTFRWSEAVISELVPQHSVEATRLWQKKAPLANGQPIEMNSS